MRMPRCVPAPRRGAVLAWLVASLGVVVAVVAIGMDGGRLMDGRRSARAAADAAVLAAAADLYANYATNQGTDPLGTARQAALNSAAANGYANDGTTSTVTVNVPPTQGTFAGQTDYVEVVLQVQMQGSFSAAINGGNLPLQVRAVARGRPKKIGVLVLNPNAAGAFSGLGLGTLDIIGSTITVNSTSLLAFLQIGGTIQATLVAVVGNLLLTGGNLLALIQTGGQPTADPLSTLPAPNPAAYVVQSNSQLTISSGTVVLQPGVYQGGIAISGSANVTLMPGVYILGGGGFQVSGSASVTGNGVMLYNTTGTAPAGQISFTTSGKVTLSPPTTGTYTGLSIFQDRSLNQAVQITANNNILLTGSVYAAGAQVQLNGNGLTDVVGGSLISNRLNFSSNGRITVNPSTGRPLVPEVFLVE